MSDNSDESDWKVILLWTAAIPVLLAYKAGSVIAEAVSKVGHECSFRGKRKMRRASRYVAKKREKVRVHVPERFRTPALFPNFSKLPYEIRAEIWRFACENPRIIEIKLGRPGPITRRHWSNHTPQPWISPTAPPIGLWVCQESRKETLRSVELAFGRDGFEPKIYVNFERDTIFFRELPDRDSWLGLTGYLLEEHLSLMRIRSLAVGHNHIYNFLWVLKEIHDVMLTEVVFVNAEIDDKPIRLGKTPMWAQDWRPTVSPRAYPYSTVFEVQEELELRKSSALAGKEIAVRCMEFVKKGRNGVYKPYGSPSHYMPLISLTHERGHSIEVDFHMQAA